MWGNRAKGAGRAGARQEPEAQKASGGPGRPSNLLTQLERRARWPELTLACCRGDLRRAPWAGHAPWCWRQLLCPPASGVDSRSSFPAGHSCDQLSRWVSWRGQAVAQEARGQGVQLGRHTHLRGSCVSPPQAGCGQGARAVWCDIHWHPVSLKSQPWECQCGGWGRRAQSVVTPASARPAAAWEPGRPGRLPAPGFLGCPLEVEVRSRLTKEQSPEGLPDLQLSAGVTQPNACGALVHRASRGIVWSLVAFLQSLPWSAGTRAPVPPALPLTSGQMAA